MKFKRFFEDKNRLIDKLPLSNSQKDTLKDFFKKYPNYESKIDWNRKDLSWKDFQSLLDNEGKSKSQAKKYGISGLVEGKDYKLLKTKVFTNTDNEIIKYRIYYPLTFLGSETLANPRVAPVGITGKWCISGGNYGPGNSSKYWDQYTQKDFDFFFVFTETKKFAISRDRSSINPWQVFDQEDHQCSIEDLINTGFTSDEIRDLIEFILKSPNYLEDSKYVKDSFGVVFNKDSTVLVKDSHKEDISLESGKKEPILSKKEYKIPEGVISVQNRAFADSWLTGVIFPDSLQELGSYCFLDSKLNYIDFGNSNIEKIPEGCFIRTNLKQVRLSKNILEIKENAFNGCKQLQHIILNQGLTSICLKAFCNNTALENIEFPESLKVIGTSAFEGCEKLKELSFSEGFFEIENGAFAQCVSLEKVHLPKSLRKIGFRAFGNCHNLKLLEYPGTFREFLLKVQNTWIAYPTVPGQCPELVLKFSDKELPILQFKKALLEELKPTQSTR